MKFTYPINDNEVFVIAEAGSNWKAGTLEEDLQRSEELIKAASDAGADAIKFQTYRSSSVYSENAGKSEYLTKQGINENIEEIFDKFSMPYEMIPKLAKICNEKQIEFMSMPFSVEDAKQIDPFVSVHKVASFEINHVRLLEFLAKTKKPIFISTGASTTTEIEFALDICKNNGNDKVTILQCTSKYPAPLSSMNLSVIKNLKEKFDIPVGFSDHSVEPIIAPLLSISYGASVIEKHFTIDKKLSGPDHSFALEPKELKRLISSIRGVESILGSNKKAPTINEEKNKIVSRRSLVAKREIRQGNIFSMDNLTNKRPGNGISPFELWTYIGKKSK